METEIIMYSRSTGCPFVTLAKRVLDDYKIPYREILIDKDDVARERVRTWTGFLAVPTLVVAVCGDVLPYAQPFPLQAGASPRGINRGSMMTEPNIAQLTAWLQQHGFLSAEDVVVE